MIRSCGIDQVETIFFDWPLTNWCNYKCSYCPVIDIITNDFTVEDHTSMYKLTLAKLRKVETPFNICLTGGEPTLHPNILDILDELDNIPLCQDVSLFTNLSRPPKFYTKITPSNKIVVFASYHPEFATEKFLERCIELKNMGTVNFSVHVTLSDKKEHWDKTIDILEQLKLNNILFKPYLIAPTNFYTPIYDEEFNNLFLSYLENTGENSSGNNFFKTIPVVYDNGESESIREYEFELRALNKFKGYNCKPVSYSIRLDGTIENTCTKRVVPLSLTNKNLIVSEVCPNEICPSRRLINFYKWK